jgi:hypothetical protein
MTAVAAVAAQSAASQAAPGVLGFLVVAGMGIILFFLFRSMAKHLRKVAPAPVTAAGQAAATGEAARPGPDQPGRVATGTAATDAAAAGDTDPPGQSA